MKPRVWINVTLHPSALALLQAATEIISTGDLADLPGADAIIITSLVDADGTFMDQAGPTLKVIARPGIGVDNIDSPAATERGILVVNTPNHIGSYTDLGTKAMGEGAVKQMLQVLRGERPAFLLNPEA